MSLCFLLDEDMPPDEAAGLRRVGDDAISVHEEGRTGLSDEEQLLYATSLGGVLVTYNRRDFQLLDGSWHTRGERHCGIIWVTEAIVLRRAIGLQVRALRQMADSFETLDDLIVPLRRPHD